MRSAAFKLVNAYTHSLFIFGALLPGTLLLSQLQKRTGTASTCILKSRARIFLQ